MENDKRIVIVAIADLSYVRRRKKKGGGRERAGE